MLGIVLAASPFLAAIGYGLGKVVRNALGDDPPAPPGPGLLDPSDPSRNLDPAAFSTMTAEQLAQFNTDQFLPAMNQAQYDAFVNAINRVTAEAAEIQRKANLTFPTSLTQQEVDALSPEARADYYDRVANAVRPVNYNAVASEPTADHPDWQYSVSFMNGIGQVVHVKRRTLGGVRDTQMKLALAGVGSISHSRSLGYSMGNLWFWSRPQIIYRQRAIPVRRAAAPPPAPIRVQPVTMPYYGPQPVTMPYSKPTSGNGYMLIR